MPIDVDRLLAQELTGQTAAWSADDVILYNLATGAGDPPEDPGELAYAWEGALKVLPSFAVLPAQSTLEWLMTAPGFDVPLQRILHGEQELELLRPLEPSGRVHTDARVTHVLDKGEGKAAVIVLEATTAGDDGPLFVNRFTIFARGEGGCGAAGNGGLPLPAETPERPPDVEVDAPTLRQQALLYRLCGDKNPLHADPEFARRAGFERPILHGLCSYGIVCKAIADATLGGEVERLRRYSARFAGVAYPGETLRVRMWTEPGRVLATAHAAERDAPVLSNVVVETGEAR